MNRSGRQVVAECVVILGMVIGAWIVMIHDRAAELRSLEGRIQQMRAQPVGVVESMIGEISGRIESMRQRVRDVRARSAFGLDSNRLYDTMMRCAREHEIEAERLNPSQRKDPGARPASVNAMRFSVNVRGRYNDLIRFVEALQALDGFVRPVLVRLSPGQKRGECTGQIDCELVSFTIPASLETALLEHDHGTE